MEGVITLAITWLQNNQTIIWKVSWCEIAIKGIYRPEQCFYLNSSSLTQSQTQWVSLTQKIHIIIIFNSKCCLYKLWMLFSHFSHGLDFALMLNLYISWSKESRPKHTHWSRFWYPIKCNDVPRLKIWRHTSRRVNYASLAGRPAARRAAALFFPMFNFDLGW